jgi:hypothetical protein
MLATLPIEPLKPPAYGLCFIAEEKENLNSDWDTQINHGEAGLYCLSRRSPRSPWSALYQWLGIDLVCECGQQLLATNTLTSRHHWISRAVSKEIWAGAK